MALTVNHDQFADDGKNFRAIVTIDDFLQDINLFMNDLNMAYLNHSLIGFHGSSINYV